jgi:hypothetical protein
LRGPMKQKHLISCIDATGPVLYSPVTRPLFFFQNGGRPQPLQQSDAYMANIY